MLNYRVWVRGEYRGLMKAECDEVALEVARQWSGGHDMVRVEQTRIPSIITLVDSELKRLLGEGK